MASRVLTCTLHTCLGGAVRPLPRAQTSRIVVVRLLGQVAQVRDLLVLTGEVIILDQFKVMGFALGEARGLVLCTAARPSVALVPNQRLLALPFALPRLTAFALDWQLLLRERLLNLLERLEGWLLNLVRG